MLCSYPGYNSHDWQESIKPTVGWKNKEVTNLGFISPDQYGGPDIICHRNAKPATESVIVEAGGTVELQWTAWPVKHHGPVITYLANCQGSCLEVDKESLKFSKIDEAGLFANSTTPRTTGRYGTDKLIANGNKWTLTIPSYVAAGNYVLRHEIIALHAAYDPNGAQNYPQCINLEITGKGTDDLSSGTPGESLYTADEPGILIDIYRDVNYIIPGPPLYKPGQAKSPSKSTKKPITEEDSTLRYTSAISMTISNESPVATSTLESLIRPATTSAGKLPIISASPHVASGNFSAPLSSHCKSSSAAHSTGIVSPSLTPTSTSASISRTSEPVVVFNTVTSIQTATLVPTPQAGSVTTPIYKYESSPQLTSKKLSEESSPTATPAGSNNSKGDSGAHSYGEDSHTHSPIPKGSPTHSDNTKPPNVPEHNHVSKAPHSSTISELFDLLEKTICKLRKELGIPRKHPRDIVHHGARKLIG